MECQCKRQCNCMKCELKRYIQKTIKEEMIVPKDGKDGVDGYTPIKEVDYFDGINGIDGLDGKGVPTVYHFVVSESGLGNIMHIGKNIDYSVAKDGKTGLLAVRLQGTMSAIGKTIVDVNWTSNDNYGLEENIEINNMYHTIIKGIQSMDLHKTTIRSKNARTGLWEMYEVNMLPSMNNTRIDVWVYEIYKDFVGEWK